MSHIARTVEILIMDDGCIHPEVVIRTKQMAYDKDGNHIGQAGGTHRSRFNLKNASPFEGDGSDLELKLTDIEKANMADIIAGCNKRPLFVIPEIVPD